MTRLMRIDYVATATTVMEKVVLRADGAGKLEKSELNTRKIVQSVMELETFDIQMVRTVGIAGFVMEEEQEFDGLKRNALNVTVKAKLNAGAVKDRGHFLCR